GAAAEPPLGGDDVAGVHMDRRNQRRARMGDQRDAARPEARVLGGARDLAAELGREFAEHGRDIDADLLEDPTLHQRDDAAAAPVPVGAVALPGRAGEPSAAARRARSRVLVLDRLEGGADAVAQRREPGGGLALARLDRLGGRFRHSVTPGKSAVWRSASPNTMAAARATLIERTPGRIGTTSRAALAACTSGGAPADSRPSTMT